MAIRFVPNNKTKKQNQMNKNTINLNFNHFSRKNLLPKLQRNERNRNALQITMAGKPPTFATELDTYTHYLPLENEIKDKRMYVVGGIRFGGRYPDIIIDSNDFKRAQEIFQTTIFPEGLDDACSHFVKSILKIVKYVRTAFHTDNAVKFEIGDDGIPKVDTAWTQTIDKGTSCFLEEIYKCKGWNGCKIEKVKLPNSLTNITALPYFIGDCREHAWLSGFLSHVFIQNCCDQYRCYQGDIRIFYTKAFLIDDTKKFIRFLEDHVFVIFRDKDGKITIIDPLYAEEADAEGNYIKYNSNVSAPIRLCDLSTYTGFQDLLAATCLYKDRGSSSPVLHCGNVFLNNKAYARIGNVPIIYDGTTKYIPNDSRIQSTEDILALNKLFKKTNLHYWKNHNSWCMNTSEA